MDLTFPTEPGSLIRARDVWNRSRSDVLIRLPDATDMIGLAQAQWFGGAFGYKFTNDLTLIEILHDEGRAKLLASLPDWDSLSNVDKGCALLYARKVDQEGHEYAGANHPARFLDHPVLAQLTPAEACGYVGRLGFRLDDIDAVRFEDDREDPESEDPREMTWDEFHRLHDLALDAKQNRGAGGAS